MDDSFDALMNEPVRRRPGRPTNEERARREAEARSSLSHQAEVRAAMGGQTKINLDEFRMPVTHNFLAKVLNMDPATVKKRLTRCRPVATDRNRSVYYFHEAIHFLVKPRMTAEEFARSLNKADLPPEINKAFWDSQRSRVKYKIESQEAFEAEDVMQALGNVAMIFKDSLTMVVEEMRNRAGLTEEQTEILQGCIDELRKEIRTKLMALPGQTQTPSMFGKPMFGVSGDIDTDPDIPEDSGWLADDDEDEGFDD